jgi:NADH dehydrogenase
MIGRNAAVPEMGKRRHELHGAIAFAAWLGVHAWLMSGVRERIHAFIAWGGDYFSSTRARAILDRPDIPKID